MQIIDHQALNEFIQGDAELLADLASIFTQHLPDMEARLRLAIADGDARALCDSAHQLKSRLGYFGAFSLQATAAELEELGRNQRLDDANSLIEQLLIGCRSLLVELSACTGLSLDVSDE